MYKYLFKDIINTYRNNEHGKRYNNYYFDKNRKKFGLVEKRKID